MKSNEQVIRIKAVKKKKFICEESTSPIVGGSQLGEVIELAGQIHRKCIKKLEVKNFGQK